MVATVSVHFRLSQDAWETHSAVAQVRGLSLAAHLRQVVEEGAAPAAELQDIGAMVRKLADGWAPEAAPAEGGALASKTEGMQLEILLLLRRLAKPGDADMAQGEVKRQGLEVWRG